jgi:hypothetical protein
MEVPMKRRVEAAMLMLTGVVGRQTNKARALTPREYRGQRAVVSAISKPTGVGVISTRAGHVFNASGLADTEKLAFLLSLRPPGDARYGVGNDHVSGKPSPNHLRVD